MEVFVDRVDAGRQLAAQLAHLKGSPDLVVLGLPRGGVVVAAEVARTLDAPLDALVVAKVRVPWQPELAMGACAAGGIRVTNDRVARRLAIDEDTLHKAWAEAEATVDIRNNELRGGADAPDVRGKTVVLVDDGLATGATARAAVEAVRAMGANRIVLAVPVAPRDTAEELAAMVDDVVVLMAPVRFGAVGSFYLDFSQTTDAQARALLTQGDW